MSKSQTLPQVMAEIRAMMQEQAGAALQETARTVLTVLVEQTPVHTGQARGGWQVGLDQPENSPGQPDPLGGATINRGQAVIAQAQADTAIYLSNHVPYVAALNDGDAAHEPAGFVQSALTAAI